MCYVNTRILTHQTMGLSTQQCIPAHYQYKMSSAANILQCIIASLIMIEYQVLDMLSDREELYRLHEVGGCVMNVISVIWQSSSRWAPSPCLVPASPLFYPMSGRLTRNYQCLGPPHSRIPRYALSINTQ